MMHKVVCVAWDAEPLSREAREVALLKAAQPALRAAGAVKLSMCIADTAADVPSPSPFPLGGQVPSALVNLWVRDLAVVPALVDVLTGHGFRVAAYQVEESVYKDYGDNTHAAPRDWPDGQRSPGITAVTFMERPAKLDRATWVERWHGTMSPVSEAIQPRTRYVRNLVLTALTSDAPPFEGIVEEAWPSAGHVRNPFLFYGASNPVQLVVNMGRILWAVTRFLTLWRVQTVMMSEWFLVTDPEA